MTAQLDAWVGTRRGAIHEAAQSIDGALADAALGRMMLHRRRAAAAIVLQEFFARAGSRFVANGEGGSPAASLQPETERAIAANAGELVAELCGVQPPLAFERALLAEERGRVDEARSDLKQVLAAHPSFLAAAIAAARLALASGDPTEALRALAPVEGEIAHTRNGAALLADAARAVGLYKSASRYDLAALVRLGEYDSRGNDCAPIDLTGKIADDDRMPQSLYLEAQADGSVFCNVGGLYYKVNPFIGHWLSIVLIRGRQLSRMRSLGPRAGARQDRAIAQSFEAAKARLHLFLGSRFPDASANLRRLLAPAARGLQRTFDTVIRTAAKVDLALLALLYRLYRRSPASFRAFVHSSARSLATTVRPLVQDTVAPLMRPRGSRFWLFSPVTEAKARGELAQARYQTGVARIFGLGPVAAGTWEPTRPATFLDEPFSAFGKLSPETRALRVPPSGTLPPKAEAAFRLLVSETDTVRTAS